MTLADYRGLLQVAGSAEPVHSLNSAGSAFVVANTNALAAQAHPTDPWETAAGAATQTNHGNVRPVATNGRFMYASVYLAWRGSDVTTNPVVRVYGRVPDPNIPAVDRKYPADDDTDFNTAFASEGLWVPLPQLPILADPEFALELMGDDGAAAEYTVGSNDTKFSKPRTVYLQGTTKLIVHVSTAGVGPSDAVVLVRLHG